MNLPVPLTFPSEKRTIPPEREFVLRYEVSQNLPHYVYTLAYPESMGGYIFYIGEGVGDRIDHHERKAKRTIQGQKCSYKCNVIRKILRAGERVVKKKVACFKTEKEALLCEVALIFLMKPYGHLTNLTDGGEGATGWRATGEQRRRASFRQRYPDRPLSEMGAYDDYTDVTYESQYRGCSKPNCSKCNNGQRGHGPYWYAYKRGEDGKVSSSYVGKKLPHGVQGFQRSRKDRVTPSERSIASLLSVTQLSLWSLEQEYPPCHNASGGTRRW